MTAKSNYFKKQSFTKRSVDFKFVVMKNQFHPIYQQKYYWNSVLKLFVASWGASWKLFGLLGDIVNVVINKEGYRKQKKIPGSPQKARKNFRAEIQKYFCWYFEWNWFFIRTFWNWLTFSSILGKVMIVWIWITCTALIWTRTLQKRITTRPNWRHKGQILIWAIYLDRKRDLLSECMSGAILITPLQNVWHGSKCVVTFDLIKILTHPC